MLTNPHIGEGRLDPNEPSKSHTLTVELHISEIVRSALSEVTKKIISDMVQRTLDHDRRLANAAFDREIELVVPRKTEMIRQYDKVCRWPFGALPSGCGVGYMPSRQEYEAQRERDRGFSMQERVIDGKRVNVPVLRGRAQFHGEGDGTGIAEHHFGDPR